MSTYIALEVATPEQLAAVPGEAFLIDHTGFVGLRAENIRGEWFVNENGNAAGPIRPAVLPAVAYVPSALVKESE